MSSPTLAPSPGPKDVVVKILLDDAGQIKAVPDPFWVSEGKDEKVMWVCTKENHQHGTADNPCFTVDFNTKDGSPFHGWHFSGHGASSGLAIKGGPYHKVYKYTISMSGKSCDPGGGVTP
jgi:hypothetical protein